MSKTVIDARVSGLIGRFYEAIVDDVLWTGIVNRGVKRGQIAA